MVVDYLTQFHCNVHRRDFKPDVRRYLEAGTSFMIGWINTHITHNRDKVGDFGIRVVIHIIPGIIMSVPFFGWGLVYLFYKYQRNEDAHTEDEAWKDIYGAMVGFVIGMVPQVYYAWRYLCSKGVF